MMDLASTYCFVNSSHVISETTNVSTVESVSNTPVARLPLDNLTTVNYKFMNEQVEFTSI